MKHFSLIVAALLGASSLPAAALDFGNGFSATGEVEVEYFSDGSGLGSETVGYGSVDLAYQQQGGGFGAFVGVDAFRFFGEDFAAVYGAVTYSGDFGKIQIGAPRAALDDYFDAPILGGFRLSQFELGSGTSVLTLIALTGEIETPVGLRYDGTAGAAKFGASYHSVNGARILDVAGNYSLGNTVLSAGVEYIESGGFDQTMYHLGAEATFGKVKLGALLSDLAIFSLNSTQLYAIYSPTSELDLTVSAMSIDDVLSGTLYSAAARYTFTTGLYAEAGFLDNSVSDPLYTVSLGMTF